MTADTRNTRETHQLVLRARRAVLPDGTRPATVVVDDGRITALLGPGADVSVREEIVVPGD